MKTGKIIWIVFMIAAVVIAAWFIFFRKKNSQGSSDSFPLQLGSKGDRVRNLQAALNGLLDSDHVPVVKMMKPSKIVVNGVFDEKTGLVLNYFFAKQSVDQENYFNLTGNV